MAGKDDILLAEELGNEFGVGTLQAGRVRLYSRLYIPVVETDLHDDADSTVDLGTIVSPDPLLWSKPNVHSFQFQGSPSHVEFSGFISAEDSGASSFWSRPRIGLVRNQGLPSETVLAPNMSQIVMQTTGTYDGSFYVAISVVDNAPGVNPIYSIVQSNIENRTATLPADAESHVAAKAWA